ncbi:hypothetical protein JHK87_042251 [Glycine soja]|nr:hypothetical protein JHK87_042251 [Glycine soja]
MTSNLKPIVAVQAGNESNHGTSSSLNNSNGNQNITGSKINAGANSGDKTRYENSRVINNNGTFNGNANGCFIEGGSHTTQNYFDGRKG